MACLFVHEIQPTPGEKDTFFQQWSMWEWLAFVPTFVKRRFFAGQIIVLRWPWIPMRDFSALLIICTKNPLVRWFCIINSIFRFSFLCFKSWISNSWWLIVSRNFAIIELANDLLPDGTKPLPEPMQTYHQYGSLTLISGLFLKEDNIPQAKFSLQIVHYTVSYNLKV